MLNFATSYYNRNILIREISLIMDYVDNKNSFLFDITQNLFENISNIPSGSSITLCHQSNPQTVKFLWINKQNLYSLWNLSLNNNNKLDVTVEITGFITNRTFHFEYNGEIPQELSQLISLEFSIKDTDLNDEPLAIETLYLSTDFKPFLENKYHIFNNSVLKNHESLLLDRFKTIEQYDIITFHYYDGPLSGIHLIDGKYYFYCITGYWNIWFCTPSVSRLIQMSDEHSKIIQEWMKIREEQGDTYAKNHHKIKYSNHGTLNIPTLFYNDEIKREEAEKILKEIELEHDRILENQTTDFYMLY